ncbi:glutamate-1-semialdehyde-2,1-aminomutase [candidate division LCP-89 bacterium B3_LCP]|uniref:Glutamate-1-semialdehyde 2,1-aminomutase n=1 Tax=candidate division LCP-89 bacterium B3_LCP TaxID=2012998 RepID=A0A532V0Z5_UNCL8|nr:MAG: glutamate-1-semialdehyde-2,1-aminomutase [candidate division LCP-89 bacterium B3_LCP]
MKTQTKSQAAFVQAKRAIPGGVNSPVRAYGSVDGDPPFIERGEGAYIYDIDGNEYIDYVLSWGPMILGHAHPAVVEAVKVAADKGTSFGAPTEAETELAQLVKLKMPHIEKLRLVNSGTEAVMTAARIVRGYTGREIIVKFDGCYHGHSDGFLVAAGSGLATGGLPASAGVPGSITENTLSLPYNNIDMVEDFFRRKGDQIAGVIVEPIAANMGVVLPHDGFLEGLREITRKHSALLVFDEVITGFRVARGGASQYLDVIPDLVCLGKIIGGGLPIGAVGGRKDVMEKLAPLGEVYQAGTLSGNPISVAAGIATLRELEEEGFYDTIRRNTERLAESLLEVFTSADMEVQINTAPGLLTVFFSQTVVTDFLSAKDCNDSAFRKFFQGMLTRGIYLPPSPYEAWFFSIQHNDTMIKRTMEAVTEAIDELKL